MTWYVASLLFEAVHTERQERGSTLWEERHVLLEARSQEEANTAAATYGASSTVSYDTQKDGKVDWKFRQIERIFEIHQDRLDNGTEVFSRFLKGSEAASLLSRFPDE